MLILLLSSSVILGLLAFFEPCTIATHTLYSAKIKQANNNKQCCQSIFAVWLSRSLLLSFIFTTLTLLTSPIQWGEASASIILSLIGLIYLVSRKVYIPLPHMEVYRLIPFTQNLPYALKLGLTLPACTLPLVIVVAGLAATFDSELIAAFAGFLFASFFTVPLFITSLIGLSKDALNLLNRAATISPYITSAVLFILAVILLEPELNFNISDFKQSLTEVSLAGIGLSFAAGLVFSFNPVSFASVPVVLAYITHANNKQDANKMAGAFIGGMILTHVLLGLIAALGGEWVQGIMGRHWGLVLGPVLILLGFIWAGWLNIPIPWFGIKAKKVSGPWGAFALGIPFSVAVCPFCTPALLVALTASAAIGSVTFGMALLLAFALGRSIPVILGAWSIAWIESLQLLSKYQKIFELAAGFTLILTGLYMLNEYFFII